MNTIACISFGFVTIIIAIFAVTAKGVVIDCYTRTPAEYNGHQQTTKDGAPCIRWDSLGYKDDQFPDTTVSDAANFCRALGSDRLLCLTSKKTTGKCGIKKCDDFSLSKCGSLKIEKPALLGRNVTFTFTPYTFDPHAILEWQRSNKANPWYTRPFTYKFTQYNESGTYYMILTDSEQGNDEVYYRVHYYNETTHCWMETERLQLDDNPSNACGFVYLRNDLVLEDEEIHLEYYPSKNVMEHPSKYIPSWKRSRKGRKSDISIDGNIYCEDQTGHGVKILIFNIANERMNGQYMVDCGGDARITNEVPVIIKEPPSAPLLQGLQDIDGCEKCFFGSDREKNIVHCKTSGGTQPVTVNVLVRDKSFQALQNDRDSSDYVASISLTDQYHKSTITCSVMNGALLSPLYTTAHVYIIKPPINLALSVPSELMKGNHAQISCLVKSSRPSPKVYLDISGTNVSSAEVKTTFNQSSYLYTNTVTLRSVKREWNGKNVSCCRYSEWYTPSRKCSEPKQINLLYPPVIEFNISGTTLNIPKGDRANIKCLADSVPASNISWIEKTVKEDENIVNKCFGEPECGLDIDANEISKRQFVCAARYFQNLYRRTLIVYIQQSRKQNQLSDNEAGSDDFMNSTLLWIILGTCLTLVVFVSIVIVIRKKLITVNGKLDKKQLKHERNNLPPRENEYDETWKDVAHADDHTEVTYSKPIKEKNVSVESVETYSKVDKPMRRNKQVAEGQLSVDGQLMYVDLEFSADECAPTEAFTKRRNSPTEYVAIDFAKTASYVANENETIEMDNVYVNQQNVLVKHNLMK